MVIGMIIGHRITGRSNTLGESAAVRRSRYTRTRTTTRVKTCRVSVEIARLDNELIAPRTTVIGTGPITCRSASVGA